MNEDNVVNENGKRPTDNTDNPDEKPTKKQSVNDTIGKNTTNNGGTVDEPFKKYEIKRARRKGNGMFATQDIEQKQPVYFEPCLLWIPEEIRLVKTGDSAMLEIDSTLRMAIQMVGILESQEEANLEKKEKIAEFVENHHINMETTERILDYAQKIQDLTKFTDRDMIIKILNSVRYNAFPTVAYPSGKRYGLGLFDISSYMNHQCLRPNCRWFASPYGMIMLPIREIHKGEELTCSYQFSNSNLTRTAERHAIFEQQLGFDCKCIDCKTKYGEADLEEICVLKPESHDMHKIIMYLFGTSKFGAWIQCNNILFSRTGIQDDDYPAIAHIFLNYAQALIRMDVVPRPELCRYIRIGKILFNRLKKSSLCETMVCKIIQERLDFLILISECCGCKSGCNCSGTPAEKWRTSLNVVASVQAILEMFERETGDDTCNYLWAACHDHLKIPFKMNRRLA